MEFELKVGNLFKTSEGLFVHITTMAPLEDDKDFVIEYLRKDLSKIDERTVSFAEAQELAKQEDWRLEANTSTMWF